MELRHAAMGNQLLLNEQLDAVYAFLESIGYGMSDMEKQLQNAEHPLFEGET